MLDDEEYLSGFQISRHIVSPIVALRIVFRWLAYPHRYGDIIPRFGRSLSDFSPIFNQVSFFFHARFGHLFSSLDHAWLSSENLVNFANVVHNEGGALDNCWGFTNITVRACIIDVNERIFYRNVDKCINVPFLDWIQEKA